MPPKADQSYQCRHIKPNGNRCGSPSLRHEPFCYYHHTARRPGPRQPQVRTATDRKSSTFDLPSPADLNDRAGIQLAIALLLHKIAHNEIDPRRAGLLLYGLQIASSNLKSAPTKKTKGEDDDLVEELTHDDTHGALAPETEWEDSRAVGPMTALLRKMERLEQEEIQARERGELPTYPPHYTSDPAAYPPLHKLQATATSTTPKRTSPKLSS